MFDAGDGSLMRIRQKTDLPLHKMDRIFVSHMHGDHFMGVPSVVASIIRSIKAGIAPHSVIDIYGPFGLRPYLHHHISLRDDKGTYFRVHQLDRNEGIEQVNSDGERNIPASRGRWLMYPYYSTN